MKVKAERKWAEENDGENEGEAGEENGQGEDGSYNAYCGAYEYLSLRMQVRSRNSNAR